MKVQSGKGDVVVVLTAKEAMSLADRLVKCAIKSGSLDDRDRGEPKDQELEERER